MFKLTKEDRILLSNKGITENQFYNQLDLITKGVPFIDLIKPCTLGDGIRVLKDYEVNRLVDLYDDKTKHIKPIKFVPASGAASRMFSLLNKIRVDYISFKKRLTQNKLEEDDRIFLKFIGNIPDYAFCNDLEKSLLKNNMSLRELMSEKKYEIILDYVLTDKGLGYLSHPKGLIKFHRYEDDERTPFEEHLVEALSYSISNKVARVHFTILKEHEKKIYKYIKNVLGKYKKNGIDFEITYSVQDTNTDIIAVDFENKPLRDKTGSLVFRPGGHGALLPNLNKLDSNIIFVKNIDNIVTDRLKRETIRYKKALAGLLTETKTKILNYLGLIKANKISDQQLDNTISFLNLELGIEIPKNVIHGNEEIITDFIYNKLNRPIRVCGVVKNPDQPGGGPFWVRDSSGNRSKQIVELAQVNMNNKGQSSIWKSSTHFNPVDLICDIYDYEGNKFDLQKHVDMNTVFITKKTKDGLGLKSMELPGLWNGSMADWNTIFVEVPLITFNPVKTVFHLLNNEHLPNYSNL